MKIAAHLERSKRHDRRSKPRHRLRLGTNFKSTGEKVSIHDLSSTGMLIETDVELGSFDSLEVDLPENGPTEALVMWSSGRFYGCEFRHPLSKAAISAAFLRSTPTERVSRRGKSPANESTTLPLEEPDAGSSREPNVEDRLPLRVRAVAIIASAILLWALTIWAAEGLIRLVGGTFG